MRREVAGERFGRNWIVRLPWRGKGDLRGKFRCPEARWPLGEPRVEMFLPYASYEKPDSANASTRRPVDIDRNLAILLTKLSVIEVISHVYRQCSPS